VEKYYGDADALIHDESIDAVYIATPPDSHKFYGLRVSEAGKPCCIEKPLAPSYEESQAIVDAFNKADVPLFVAYYRRSLPRFNKVKSLISSAEIGTVRHISWQLIKPASQTDLSGQYNWRTDKNVAVGGYFDDLASHGLDLFAYLFGDYQKVAGIGVNQQKLYTSLDSVAACWGHKNGITGTGNWNFGGSTSKDEVTVYGSEGEISFSIFDDQPVLLKKAGQQQAFDIGHPENIQLYHVQNMKEALFIGCEHPSSGKTAAHTSWVMDQILALA
jgi:predicted dehydrogenase